MLRVVIIGYGSMFTNLIAASLDAGVEIAGVLSEDTIKYPAITGKLKDILNPSPEYNYIRSYNLPEIKGIKSVNSEEFKKKLLKLHPDIILVGSWGEKISKEIYNLPRIASINVHPSLLPKYRGPNPYFQVIRNRETETGVTFHLIDDGFDTGAILAQEKVKIYSSDTGESLKQRVVLTARGAACELLNTLEKEIIIPRKQEEESASYFSYPDGLELDFNNAAEKILAIIRGIHPWGRAYFYHGITPIAPNPHKTFIEVNRSYYTSVGTVIEVNPKTKMLAIICGDGKVLKMEDVSIYRRINKYFTSNYIRREIKEGSII